MGEPTLIKRLRTSAAAFRKHPIYTQDGDPVLLTVQADECDKAADALAVKDAEIAALTAERDRLREAVTAINRDTWCWPPDDDVTYERPLEWAEYYLEPSASPCVAEFHWAGRLPRTWTVFTWVGDLEDGEYHAVDYETEEAANAAALAGGGSDGLETDRERAGRNSDRRVDGRGRRLWVEISRRRGIRARSVGVPYC